MASAFWAGVRVIGSEWIVAATSELTCHPVDTTLIVPPGGTAQVMTVPAGATGAGQATVVEVVELDPPTVVDVDELLVDDEDD